MIQLAGEICDAERAKRDSQRDAVLLLMTPLLTALPNSLSTRRIWFAALS